VIRRVPTRLPGAAMGTRHDQARFPVLRSR
jgi:hypothetical protein